MPGAKDCEGAGVVVKKGGAPHRANLTIAKEPRERYVSGHLPEHVRVVVGSTATIFRMRKSPCRGHSFSSSITIPRNNEWAASRRSRSPERSRTSVRTVRGARPSSPSSTCWRQDVTCTGLPIGRHPWATIASTATSPCRATPTRPERWTWSDTAELHFMHSHLYHHLVAGVTVALSYPAPGAGKHTAAETSGYPAPTFSARNTRPCDVTQAGRL